jgi:hypothetical protein
MIIRYTELKYLKFRCEVHLFWKSSLDGVPSLCTCIPCSSAANVTTGNFLYLLAYTKSHKLQRESKTSRPAVGTTQPPIQWAPDGLLPGVKRPGREDDNRAVCEGMWSYTFTPLYVFMSWYLIKLRDKRDFTFNFLLVINTLKNTWHVFVILNYFSSWKGKS